jgi:cytochrome c553
MRPILHAFTLAVLAAASAGDATAAAAPGDPKAGEKASVACAACHGADGNKTLDGTYPKLAGQYADYLIKTMQDYRSGARSNVIMVGQAANLKDKDIADIAAWYASQSSDLKDLRDFK